MCKVEFETNSAGFKVLPVSIPQICHWGGLGICDSCGKRIVESGMYIPCLNSAYCIDCYNSWMKYAKYYEEDRWFEDRHVADMTLRLSDYQK